MLNKTNNNQMKKEQQIWKACLKLITTWSLIKQTKMILKFNQGMNLIWEVVVCAVDKGVNKIKSLIKAVRGIDQ